MFPFIPTQTVEGVLRAPCIVPTPKGDKALPNQQLLTDERN